MANALVLTSGGLDSTAAHLHYRKVGYSVSGLFVDYGQPAAAYEWKAASAVCELLHEPLFRIQLTGLPGRTGYVEGRNALLISVGLAVASRETRFLAIGIHGYTEYPDCDAAFIEDMQRVADRYRQGALCIGAPFAEWSKEEVAHFLVATDSRLAPLTHSCEAGVGADCGECMSCLDRRRLRAGKII